MSDGRWRMQPRLPVDLDAARQAAERIGGQIVRTPIRYIPSLDLWLKCENRQKTGSFKLRGALNKVLSLSEGQAAKGVLAASAGNHGLGVAYAARQRGVRATVVVPAEAVRVKVDAIRALGAAVVEVPGGYAAAEAEGLRRASAGEATWVSPYNDLAVIAGQATVGLEIAEDLGWGQTGSEWRLYVPASGGGLICGIGLAVKALAPEVKVIGVQAAAAPYLYAHLRGEDMSQVQERPTIADGLAGAVESGSVTLQLLPALVDAIELVEEREIEDAVVWADRVASEIVEPSAAVALAAALADRGGGRRVVVLSGGNIEPSLLERLRESRA